MAPQSVPIPFSEPPHLNGLPSPYYTPSHLRWQAACRAFLDRHLNQHALEWEQRGELPAEVFQTFAANNMLVPALPAPLPVDWLKRLGIGDVLGTVKVEDWDYFHTAIYVDEMNRSGLMGPGSSLTVGYAFGIPPILKFGSKQLQERVLPDLLRGKERCCIAITEPDAGSDVAGITTTARKTADGRHYVVNGAKKWITNGIWADWATVAVRTGGPGPTGLSLLLVRLSGTDGVRRRRISVGGGHAGGTTYITLEDVLVPVENLIGAEGAGMRYIMTNFNHERLTIAIGVTRQSRVALGAAFEYVLKREAFGQPLVEQAVVRNRLAAAGAQLEALSAWLERIVHQLANIPDRDEADRELGGLTALIKAHAGKVMDECARCAVLLFGGNGYTQSGVGELALRIYQDVPGARIPGGSEDVMMDLAVRQLAKNYAAKTKELQRRVASKL